MSGGIVWAPVNRTASAEGITDSRQEATRLHERLTLGREPDHELLETFVDIASEAVAFIEAATPLTFMVSRGFSRLLREPPGWEA